MLIQALFAEHRRRGGVVPVVFYLQTQDSPVEDAVRDRIAAAVGPEGFVVLPPGAPAERVGAAVAAAGVHVLLECNGWLVNARHDVLALQPAPVQAHFLGYPGTTGLPSLQYMVTDRVVSPPALEAAASEAPLRLGGAQHYQVNHYLATHGRREPDAALRAALRTREGLPAEGAGAVLCSFNVLYKLDERSWALVLNLLRRLPSAVLWLLDSGAASQGGASDAARHLAAEAAAHGTAAARVVFGKRLPRAAHLARAAAADLQLDTLHINAHSTAVRFRRAPLIY